MLVGKLMKLRFPYSLLLITSDLMEGLTPVIPPIRTLCGRLTIGLEDVDLEQIYILNDRYCAHEVYGKDDLRYGDKPGLRKSPHPDNLDRILRIMERKLQSTLMLEWAKERDPS
jgi:hypothetical protein